MGDCVLCRPLVGEVRGSDHWRLVVNRNQNLLGKTMLVLRRHAVGLPELTLDEWDDRIVRNGENAVLEAYAFAARRDFRELILRHWLPNIDTNREM